MNAAISGGWKYVSPETGALFDETDYLEAYDRIKARGPAATRAWFLRNYPNHVLEARFDAWLNRCILSYSAFNRFGGVTYLCPDGAPERERDVRRELFGHMGIYGDCVARVPSASVPGNAAKGRALSHLAALEDARARGLPDVVIFEDDFQFFVPRQAANRRLGAFLEGFPEWDALLFGHRSIAAREATHDAEVLRVRGASMPHGYVARARVYDDLIAGLAAAAAAMPEGPGEGEGEVRLAEVRRRLRLPRTSIPSACPSARG